MSTASFGLQLEGPGAEFIQEKNRNRSQIQFPTFPRKEQEEG
jgi:hypothetical protein